MNLNPVTGRVQCVTGEGTRVLACDMACVAVLYDAVGEEWAQWLSDRFAGNVAKLDDGTEARVVAQIPKADLGLALYALTASDRQAHVDSPATIVPRSEKSLLQAQEKAVEAVSPAFGLPGKGLARPRKSKRAKAQPWSWRLILETGLGLMGLAPDVFWRMTLAEWRAASDGYAERQRLELRREAWSLSHLLIAAGCSPENVTVSRLLGEKERRGKRATSEDEMEREAMKIWERHQAQRAAHGAGGGAGGTQGGGDLVTHAPVPQPPQPPPVPGRVVPIG